jgi:hypothetical protein
VFSVLCGWVIFIAMKYGHKSIVLQDYTNQVRAQKHRFCAQGVAKGLTRFSHQPKSATETG